VQAVVTAALRQHERIDVLVNNAGYAVRGAVEEVPDAAVRAMFDVNVYGVLPMVRAVASVLRRRGSGSIITIGSVAGKMSAPGNGTYSASPNSPSRRSATRYAWPWGRSECSCPWSNPARSKQTSTKAPGSTRSEAILASTVFPYRALYTTTKAVSTCMRKRQIGPDAVARVVQHAIKDRSPKARYLAGVVLSDALVLHARDYL